MLFDNERIKIMKSELEEAKKEIKELLVRYGFPTYGVDICPPNKIHVECKRDDLKEEGVSMVISRSEYYWNLTMLGDDRHHHFTDKEKMLEFIENTLRELVKCC